MRADDGAFSWDGEALVCMLHKRDATLGNNQQPQSRAGTFNPHPPHFLYKMTSGIENDVWRMILPTALPVQDGYKMARWHLALKVMCGARSCSPHSLYKMASCTEDDVWCIVPPSYEATPGT